MRRSLGLFGWALKTITHILTRSRGRCDPPREEEAAGKSREGLGDAGHEEWSDVAII